MTTIDAENMVIRLINAVLLPADAQHLISNEEWMEERILDVIETVNTDGADEDACKTFARDFCQELMQSHPQAVRPGFSLESLEAEDESDE